MLRTPILLTLSFRRINEAHVKKLRFIPRSSGFTLVELIVVMAVFMTVLIISAQAFNNILSNSSRLTRSEESNIEGIIGLEVMRHDLEQMGFGLPWGFSGSIDYKEATQSDESMNDKPDGVPRAFVGYYNYSSAIIGVKASSVGTEKAAQRWSYIPFMNYSAATKESRPVNLGATSPQPGDRVIALKTSFNNHTTASLRMSGSNSFYFNYNTTGYIHDDFLPANDQETNFVYALSNDKILMPFNRADFFVSTSAGAVPGFCAPGTGVLYKATVKNTETGGGGYIYIPLVDCVASMQVVLGWSSNAGMDVVQDSVSTYTSLPFLGNTKIEVKGSGAGTPLSGSDILDWFNNKDAKRIREQLKVVKVYILAQEGKRDSSYTFPQNKIIIGNDDEKSLTREYTLTDEQRHYRWKLYRLIVKPKNLVSNQR